jgi:magnesium transporter
MQVLFVAAFSLTLSFGAAAGVNLQKLSLNQEERKPRPRPPYCQPLWMIGFAIQVMDAIGDFVCVGLAPQTLLAPIGSLSLGFNVILAPLFHPHEQATRNIIVATVLIYVGAIVTVCFAPETDPQYTLDKIRTLLQARSFWIFVVGGFASFQGAVAAHGRRHGYTLVHYCGLAGCFGGACILFTKSVSELVKNAIVSKQYDDWKTSPIPYGLVVGMLTTVFSNVNLLNQALAQYDALLVVPVYQSFWNVFAITGGLVFFQEYQYMSASDRIMYAWGIAITMIGVSLLVRERQTNTATGRLVVVGGRGEWESNHHTVEADQTPLHGAAKAHDDGVIRHRRVAHGHDDVKSQV